MALIPLALGLILWGDHRTGWRARAAAQTALAFAVGLGLTLGPFAVRNYVFAGELVLTSARGGFNLYLGNNLRNPDPYERPAAFAVPVMGAQGAQFAVEASRRVGRTLSPAESSRYWTGEVLRSAVERPGPFLWKLCQKTLALLNAFEMGDHYSVAFLGRIVAFFRLPFLSLSAVLPFGLAGMAATAWASRARRWSVVMGVAYGSTLVAFVPTDHYRLPLLAILIPFAVLGGDHFLQQVRRGRGLRAGAYVGLVLLFGIIEFLPLRGTGDMTPYLNTHALLLASRGREAEAMRYWQESSDEGGAFSAYGSLALAERYGRRGDADRAIAYLNRIPDDSFAAASKYEVLGDLLADRGLMRDARGAYERSLAINSGNLGAREKLVRALDALGEREEALRQTKVLEFVTSFYGGI